MSNPVNAMPIQALLFDLDDTLVVDEAVSHEAFERVAAKAVKDHGAKEEQFVRDAQRHARALWAEGPSHQLCKDLGISAFECLWGRFLGEEPDWVALREWALRFRVQTFDAALRDQFIESEAGAEDLAQVFSDERRRLQRLMPDAREILARLGTQYRLGLLTNGQPDLQREKLLASGLSASFPAIAISGEHRIGKPRPEIFYRLAEALGVSCEECVMIGNSKERDIAGARNAGMRSIWIKVPGSEEHTPVEADATIHGLAELPGLLDAMASGREAACA